jgi:hypothetical protein
LFSVGSSASAPTLEDDEASFSHGGEAGAIRALYQTSDAKKPRRPRGTPVRDFIQRVIERLTPRLPVLVPVPVPVYPRRRR